VFWLDGQKLLNSIEQGVASTTAL